MEDAWNMMILCLEIVGLSNGEPTFGLTVICSSSVRDKDITI